MSLLKRLDIFKSIDSDHKQTTWVGTLLSFLSFFVIMFFFFKEYQQFNSKQLQTKIVVEDISNRFIDVSIDILFLKLQCRQFRVILSIQYQKDTIRQIQTE